MKKTLSIAFTVLSLVLFAISIGIMFMATNASRNNKLLYVFDYSFSLIPSDSMIGDEEDSLDRYDMVLLTKKPYEELVIGDVIVFQSKVYLGGELRNMLKIHRIVGGDQQTGFITQGDNEITNPETDQHDSGSSSIYVDPRITEDLYQGSLHAKITFVKPLTKILIESKNLIFPIVILVLLIILFIELIHIFKDINQEKERKLKEKHEKDMLELNEKQKEELYQEILKEEKEKQNK